MEGRNAEVRRKFDELERGGSRPDAIMEFSKGKDFATAWRRPLATDFTFGVSQSADWPRGIIAFITLAR